MAFSSASTSVPSSRGSGGAAHRAVALDLMLRTFMNSPEFQPYNPRMWEGISKLVPGTTPHQCIQRWEELRSANKFIARDFSVLAAKGRPFTSSTYNTSHTHYKQDPAFTSSVTELPPINDTASSSRPPSSNAAYHYDQYRGSLTNVSYSRLSAGGGRLPGSFCQNYLYKREREDKRECQSRIKENGGVERQSSRQSLSSVSDYTLGESTTNKITPVGTPEHTQAKRTTSTPDTTSIITTNNDNNDDTINKSTTEDIEDNSRRDNTHSTNKETRDHNVMERNDSNVHVHTKDYDGKETAASTNGVSKEGGGPTDDASHCVNQLVIHVRDDAKRKSKDFLCSRELLISEMKYFKDYLSTNVPTDISRQWEEVDISVHCDIGVFHWLMTYVKRGMNEGPAGEKRDKPLEPPELSPTNAVSILISSDFLRMETLVEKCLDYCHSNISLIIASPANTSCIGPDLINKLADQFSPLEAEAIIDEKDKISSKIYFCLLEKLFNPSYHHSECPHNASTLYKCKQCGRFLTQAQQEIFTCTSSRLTVNRRGQLVHEHERDTTWSIDRYIMSLRDRRLTWRDIYWKLWGKVNWLHCSQCGNPFQCSSLSTCLHHPKPVVHVDSDGSKLPPGTGRYFCCGQMTGIFSSLPAVKGGCQYKDHTHQSDISAILTKLKDIICERVDQPGDHDSSDFNVDCNTSFSNIIKETLPLKVLNIDLSGDKKATPTQTTSPSADTNNKTKQTNNTTNTAQTNTTATSSITLDNKGKGRNGRAMGATVGTMVGQTGVGRGQSGSDDGQLVETDKGGEGEKEGGMTTRRDYLTEEDGTGSERGDTCTCSSSMASSDLEEDEEDLRKVRVVVEKPSQPLKKTVKKMKNCSTKGKAEKILSDVDWVWDNTKPVRWNQDMQRLQDELRMSQLQVHLRQLSTSENKIQPPSTRQRTVSSSSHSSTHTAGSNGGGIYVQLEGQFFANIAKSQRLSLKSKRQSLGKFK